MQYELLRLLKKCDSLNDTSLYFAMYERQMAQTGIDKIEWVGYLINLMPVDVINIVTREKEPETYDCDYIKNIILKRYKLSPE